MKTKKHFVACLAALLCGCNHEPDPKIANLQQQIDLLEDMIVQESLISSNALDLASRAIKLGGENTSCDSEIITKLENYYRATTNMEMRLRSIEARKK